MVQIVEREQFVGHRLLGVHGALAPKGGQGHPPLLDHAAVDAAVARQADRWFAGCRHVANGLRQPTNSDVATGGLGSRPSHCANHCGADRTLAMNQLVVKQLGRSYAELNVWPCG